MTSPALNIAGLTWAEYDDKPLEQIAREACAAHERRLGFVPNLVLTHHALKPTKITYNGTGVAVKPQRGILLYHYHAIHIGGKE